MTKFSFVVHEATAYRYFVPLALALPNARFYIWPNTKYNDPTSRQAIKELVYLTETYPIKVSHYKDENTVPKEGVCFFIEDVLADKVPDNVMKIGLAYQADFTHNIDEKLNKLNYLVLPSIRYYDSLPKEYVHEPKIVTWGCPKFDTKLNRLEAYDRYLLDPDIKYCLVVYPRTRDLNNIDFDYVNNIIKEIGKTPIVVFRGKENHINDCKIENAICLVDSCWYPHFTMELMYISDYVIQFDSTTVEEAVTLGKPMLNYKCKPFPNKFEWMMNPYSVCQINPHVDIKQIKNFLWRYIPGKGHTYFLPEIGIPRNSSENIYRQIERILNEK